MLMRSSHCSGRSGNTQPVHGSAHGIDCLEGLGTGRQAVIARTAGGLVSGAQLNAPWQLKTHGSAHGIECLEDPEAHGGGKAGSSAPFVRLTPTSSSSMLAFVNADIPSSVTGADSPPPAALVLAADGASASLYCAHQLVSWSHMMISAAKGAPLVSSSLRLRSASRAASSSAYDFFLHSERPVLRHCSCSSAAGAQGAAGACARVAL